MARVVWITSGDGAMASSETPRSSPSRTVLLFAWHVASTSSATPGCATSGIAASMYSAMPAPRDGSSGSSAVATSRIAFRSSLSATTDMEPRYAKWSKRSPLADRLADDRVRSST
jgi:hypothetical protein